MRMVLDKQTVQRGLFVIWCLCVSMAAYQLFTPWPNVIVLAGVIAFLASPFLPSS